MPYSGFQINEGQKKEVKSIKFDNYSLFPAIGQTDKYYKSLDDNKVFKWNGTVYVEINPELDADGKLVSLTTNPQAKRDTPLTSDVYRVLNTTACPIDPSDEVELTVSGLWNNDESRFEFQATLTSSLADNCEISLNFTFEEDSFISVGPPVNITINAGNTSSNAQVEYSAFGLISNVVITINSVAPNPNGGKTITY